MPSEYSFHLYPSSSLSLFTCLTVYLPLYFKVYSPLFFLFVCMSAHSVAPIFTHLSIYTFCIHVSLLSIHPISCASVNFLSEYSIAACLSTCLYFKLYICLSICIPVVVFLGNFWWDFFLLLQFVKSLSFAFLPLLLCQLVPFMVCFPCLLCNCLPLGMPVNPTNCLHLTLLILIIVSISMSLSTDFFSSSCQLISNHCHLSFPFL